MDWYIRQYRSISKTLCSVKETRHKKPHIVWFSLFEVLKKDKTVVMGVGNVLCFSCSGGYTTVYTSELLELYT